MAAKRGLPDPDMNARLRLAVNNAKAESMPKDDIERAIKKATGGDAETYEEIRYEGFGPGGVGVIVEVLTDNRNRAASNVRSTFAKNGGNLGETGSVAFMFDRVGQIVYPAGGRLRGRGHGGGHRGRRRGRRDRRGRPHHLHRLRDLSEVAAGAGGGAGAPPSPRPSPGGRRRAPRSPATRPAR